MRSLAVRLGVNAVALWVAATVVRGVTLTESGASTVDKVLTVLAVAAVFGLVNAFVRPVVKLVALPLYVLTLGLIIFVINALMLLLTDRLAEPLGLAFSVTDFRAALYGALVVSLVSWLLALFVGDD